MANLRVGTRLQRYSFEDHKEDRREYRYQADDPEVNLAPTITPTATRPRDNFGRTISIRTSRKTHEAASTTKNMTRGTLLTLITAAIHSRRIPRPTQLRVIIAPGARAPRDTTHDHENDRKGAGRMRGATLGPQKARERGATLTRPEQPSAVTAYLGEVSRPRSVTPLTAHRS